MAVVVAGLTLTLFTALCFSIVLYGGKKVGLVYRSTSRGHWGEISLHGRTASLVSNLGVTEAKNRKYLSQLPVLSSVAQRSGTNGSSRPVGWR